jgi:hypothetical protein
MRFLKRPNSLAQPAGGIELETFVAQKKQNLAVDDGEYQTSRHSPVRGRGSLAGDI